MSEQSAKSDKIAEMKAKIAAKQAEIAKLKQEKESREAQHQATSSQHSFQQTANKRPNVAPQVTNHPTSKPKVDASDDPHSQQYVKLSNSQYDTIDHGTATMHFPQSYYPPSYTQPQHHYGYYPPPQAYYPYDPYQQSHPHGGSEHAQAGFYDHQSTHQDDQTPLDSAFTHTTAKIQQIDTTKADNSSGSNSLNKSSLPSFKSKTLCQKWPRCRFSDSCRFFHPLLENVVISLFHPSMPLFSTLGQIQHSSASQPFVLNSGLIKVIQSEMATLGKSIPIPVPNTPKVSPSPPPHYTSLLPPLPRLFQPASSNPEQLTIIPITLPNSPSASNSTPSLTPSQLQSTIQQHAGRVPFIHFFLDVLKKSDQLSSLSQDHFLLSLGLPTLPSVFASIKAYLALGNFPTANESQTRIHSLQIPLKFPTTIPLPTPSTDPSVQQLQQAIPIDSTPVEQTATMYILSNPSSYPSKPNELPLLRIHITSSTFYQQLYPFSFQLITNSEYKSFFLATSPNTQYQSQLYQSYQSQPQSQPSQPSQTRSDRDSTQNNFKTRPVRENRDTNDAYRHKELKQHRVPLKEDPKFKIFRINFVHGGSIVQKQLTEQELQAGVEETAFIPDTPSNTSTASVPSTPNAAFQNQSLHRPHLTEGLKVIQNYDPSIDLSLIPEKYTHLTPMMYACNPSVFYTFDELMKLRYGAQLALTQRYQASQCGAGRKAEPTMFDKLKSMQFYSASTTKQPKGFFKPYTLSDLNTSSLSNAAVLEEMIKRQQESDIFIDISRDYSDDEDDQWNDNQSNMQTSHSAPTHQTALQTAFEQHNQKILDQLNSRQQHVTPIADGANSRQSRDINQSEVLETGLTLTHQHNSFPEAIDDGAIVQKGGDQDYHKELSKIYATGRSWLLNWGWVPGKGLGDESHSNIAKPIDCVVRPERFGLGNSSQNDDNSDSD